MVDFLLNGKKIEMTSNGNFYKLDRKSAEEMFSRHGRQSFDEFKKYEFPYVHFDHKKAINELKSLSSKDLNYNTRSHLISSIHKSRYSCSRYDMISPFAFWDFLKDEQNYGIWRKFYINRIMNANTKAADIARQTGILDPQTILAGFTITHKADCPSYLKPALAKKLVKTYLNDYEHIFCPFNGFSGIMLGATIGCNKKFIGQDINAKFIEESNQMIDFIKDNFNSQIDVQLKNIDIFIDNGKYDCLIACPPYYHKRYGNIEKWNFDQNGNNIDESLTCDEWIDECLERYQCNRYLFVVDDSSTVKYKSKIVQTIKNKSHFGSNLEHVVLI